MSIFDSIRNWFMAPIANALRERVTVAENVRNYRTGAQKHPLKISRDGSDDNVILNFVGLVVDRSVSLLFGKGVEFDLPGDGQTPEDEYVTEVLNLNKSQILFHKLAVFGAEQGTCVVELVPDGYWSYKLNKSVPRIVAIDPALVTIDVSAEDMEVVQKYTIQWVTTGADGKEKARKREAVLESVDIEGTATNEARWNVYDYEADQSGKWILIDKKAWEYWFAPYYHWQNLPAVDSVYGMPDITPDIIRNQDALNSIVSSTVKTLRYQAFPKTIVKNMVGEVEQMNSGPEMMWRISGENADVYNLEMQSDLGSSMEMFKQLRRALFEVTRTPDILNIAEAGGELTNLGIRVRWQDPLAKLGTKRELYGDGLLEIIRFVLVMGGFGDYPDPGEVVWPEAIPQSETENAQGYQQDLAMGIVSKQTIAGRRGYDWEQEQERIDAEKTEQNTLGNMLLAGFDRGE